MEYDALFTHLLVGLINRTFDIIFFLFMSTYTVNPFAVVVAAALSAASSMDKSGAPLQLRVIWENSLCSMGLNLEQ